MSDPLPQIKPAKNSIKETISNSFLNTKEILKKKKKEEILNFGGPRLHEQTAPS